MNGQSTPTYRKQTKANGKVMAFVVLNGQRHYLGEYDTPESRQRYHRLVGEWEAGGGKLPVHPEQVTVVEVLARYWEHVKTEHRDPDGSPSEHAHKIRRAMAPVRELYGETKAADFGPLALKAVRGRFVETGMTRQSVNVRVGYVKAAFAWAVENQLVPPSVHHGLQAVKGLRMGRSQAPENNPVLPVPDADIDAVRPHVSRQVRALIDLQLLTGARGGELLKLRPIDLNMSGTVWTCSPAEHKTAHHGHGRTIYLGRVLRA